MFDKKIRDSRIELLRIVSMFLILISHFSLRGNWSNVNSLSPLATVRLLSFDALGPAGAVVFFLITGFFVSQKGINLDTEIKKSKKKALKVWGQTIFYSATIGLFFYFKDGNMSIIDLLKDFLPFTLSRYWFVTCFILLVLISPYLNLLLDNMETIHVFKLILFLFFLQIPALLKNPIINQFLLAILGYFTGTFISRKNDDIYNQFTIVQLLLFLLAIYSLDLLSIYGASSIGISFGHAAHFTTFMLAFCFAIVLFLIFLKIKPFANRYINNIALSVFSVYLITEQWNFRELLWGYYLDVGKYQNSILFPFYGIFICAIIFIVCIFIDFIRRFLLKIVKKGSKLFKN